MADSRAFQRSPLYVDNLDELPFLSCSCEAWRAVNIRHYLQSASSADLGTNKIRRLSIPRAITTAPPWLIKGSTP
jgi:hypothetical protein